MQLGSHPVAMVQYTFTHKHSSTTLTEGFPCFFLSCKANARVYLAKKGQGPHSSKLIVIVLLRRYLYCYVVIVLYCCYLCCSVIIVLFCYYLCCSVVIVLFCRYLCCSIVIVLFCYYLCCSMYCLCVNVYCTIATGCLPNCS